ncbi:MAG TPA: alpha/beta hydrolase [Solirubrobacteraceae bacterium]|nr:alpha/beta hydrolase [Solirubrobacteraceae bacterium]
MGELGLPQGTIRYQEFGSGKPILLVHGLLVNGDLWREVAPRLAESFRVIVPDWPLGSHRLPLNPGTDLSPLGLAGIIADFMETLDLEDVTLVGNDTGGALSQLVAVHHPGRLGRLVLTPCDAYENFLPAMFRPLEVLARIPGAPYLVAQSLRPRAARRLPFAYGWLSKRPIPDDLSDAWMDPVLSNSAIRRELTSVLKGISKRYTLDAAKRFDRFDKPVLLAWAPEDRFFKLRYAERMMDSFPHARLERIEDSLTFVSLDQPERTAELIGAFASEAVG